MSEAYVTARKKERKARHKGRDLVPGIEVFYETLENLIDRLEDIEFWAEVVLLRKHPFSYDDLCGHAKAVHVAFVESRALQVILEKPDS